ncbi:MAG: IS66 family transposase [Parachlamydiaceae bacterium]
MEQTHLGEIPESKKLESFSKTELIEKYSVLESELSRVIKENYHLRQIQITDEQLKLIMEEQLQELRDAMFGSSSERYKKPEKEKVPKPPKPRVKKPSERYPNLPIREVLIAMNPVPHCQACGQVMSDSGMTEDSEQLNVIPKKFEILLQKRMKYRCQCQGCITTAPAPPRIVEGSTYSDEMFQDVVLSKYCDLIPMERYSAMAARSGLMDLPPHSLIELTHQFADFVFCVYELIKKGVLHARVLNADETPHKMLEGSEKKSWYLWGFSTPELCFLECHDTRSGDVASEILLNSDCEILVTDVYSGYGKAIKIANQSRIMKSKVPIESANCNAHARRYFFKPRSKYKEAEFYLEHYHQIYQLNSNAKGKPPSEVLELRSQMKPHFEAMKQQATVELPRYPSKNQYGKALNYFLENYDGLTLFLEDPEVPIDNNSQERLLRSHVVGRKTWYGTHSERGAKTAAVLFSVVETCKLNHVNPREYFKNLVQDLLAGKNPYTPKEFKDLNKS